MSLSIQDDYLVHSSKNKLIIKNLKTKSEKQIIEHKEFIDFVLIKSNLLISCAENIRIYSFPEFKPIHTIETASYVLCCDLSDDGKTLIYSDGIGNVCRYDLDLNNNKIIFSKPYNTTDIYFLKKEQNNLKFVFCNIGIGIYDKDSMTNFSDEYRGLGVSKDRSLIATMDSKYNIVILNSATFQVVKILNKGFHTRPVYSFHFTENRLYSGGVDRFIYKWDLVSGKCMDKVRTYGIIGSIAKHSENLYYVDTELNQVKNF